MRRRGAFPQELRRCRFHGWPVLLKHPRARSFEMGRHRFGLGFRLGLGKRNGLRQKGQIGVETGVSRLRCIRIGIHDEARAETHNTMTGGRRRLRAFVFFSCLSLSTTDSKTDCPKSMRLLHRQVPINPASIYNEVGVWLAFLKRPSVCGFHPEPDRREAGRWAAKRGLWW